MDDAALDELGDLEDTQDLAERVMRANALVSHYQELVSEISRIRREALGELSSSGISQVELARRVKMTRSRVQQLLTSGPKVERVLLGSGALTIAIGGKWEAAKASPGPVISAESHAAFQILAELARTYGLGAESDPVPPPGMVRLNRDNLVVIGSPRILPIVGQSLEADDSLGFESDEHGWYLRNRETGEVLRSPLDRGEPVDYGYIGRLPRPDGRGTFLYLAGIHALGTLGCAQYLANNIEDIYASVKNKRWSTLIECRRAARSHEIEEVKNIIPLNVAA